MKGKKYLGFFLMDSFIEGQYGSADGPKNQFGLLFSPKFIGEGYKYTCKALPISASPSTEPLKWALLKP